MFAPFPFSWTSGRPSVLLPLHRWRRWRLVPRRLPLEMPIIVTGLIIYSTTTLPSTAASHRSCYFCRPGFIVIMMMIPICQCLGGRRDTGGFCWGGGELSLLVRFFCREAYAGEHASLLFTLRSGSGGGSRSRSWSFRRGWLWRSGGGRLRTVALVVAVVMVVVVVVTITVAIIVTVTIVLMMVLRRFPLGRAWSVWGSLGTVTLGMVLRVWYRVRRNRLLHQPSQRHTSITQPFIIGFLILKKTFVDISARNK